MTSGDVVTLGPAFTVAQARRAGLSRAMVSARELQRPFHGVRAVAAFDPATLSPEDEHLRLLRAYAVAMGDHAFASHVSAAVAWGLPVRGSLLEGRPIDIAVFLPHRSPRGAGVRGYAVDRRQASTVVHPEHGFRITSPASTWAMLGGTIRHRYDLVAIADAIVRTPQHPDDPPALATVAQLMRVVSAGRRVGVGALREALPAVRAGASSRPETWTRLTLVDGGLPEPVLAVEVFDELGAFVARVDMAYPEFRVAVEYEGEHHRYDGAQWDRDIQRYERLAAAGWIVIRVTRTELFEHPASLVARVRAALARAPR
jgi:hypothetical protein